jgi:metal-responsive CopG/Arc/MetJ family transcriptional regulator
MMTPHDDVMRTIIDLPEEQLAGLARLCDVHRISRAEAVRRAVDHFLKEHRPEGNDVGFGVWKGRKRNARKHVDTLRDEWDGR